MTKTFTLKVLGFILSFSFFIVSSSHARAAMQSVGMTNSMLVGNIHDQFHSESFKTELIELPYFPGYNFIENDNSSVRIGLPVSVGLGLVRVMVDGGKIAFSSDVPVALDYNIGFKSTMDNDRAFGVYFGAGFGLSQVTLSKSNNFGYNGISYGPLGRLGVRIGSKKESWRGHGLTISIFYKKGMEKKKRDSFGFMS